MNKFAVTCLLALVAATQAYKIPPVQTNFDVLDKDSSGHVDRTEVDKHLDAMCVATKVSVLRRIVLWLFGVEHKGWKQKARRKSCWSLGYSVFLY